MECSCIEDLLKYIESRLVIWHHISDETFCMQCKQLVLDEALLSASAGELVFTCHLSFHGAISSEQ
jgi:hypothetical protein